jgi:hypothetical protein
MYVVLYIKAFVLERRTSFSWSSPSGVLVFHVFAVPGIVKVDYHLMLKELEEALMVV